MTQNNTELNSEKVTPFFKFSFDLSNDLKEKVSFWCFFSENKKSGR